MNFDFLVDFSLIYCLLTVASFRIGVPLIMFGLKTQCFIMIFCKFHVENKVILYPLTTVQCPLFRIIMQAL